MLPYELFRLLFHSLFGWIIQAVQLLLKSSKLFIIYIPVNRQEFRVADVAFYLDFVSFIKEYGVFSLILDEQKSRGDGIYRGRI